jgi:hypothetical protein
VGKYGKKKENTGRWTNDSVFSAGREMYEERRRRRRVLITKDPSL